MDYYYPGYSVPSQPKPQSPVRILVSHSSCDAWFCDVFVELLASIGFTDLTIIYTSKSEYGIPVGADIYDYLRNHLKKPIWVFFMLSDNFYQSAACLNEMGAVWIRQSRYFTVPLPGFKHEDMKGVVNRNKLTLDLCDPVRLTELLGFFRQTWGPGLPISNTRWASIQQEFISKMKILYQNGVTT